jgi:hypothetical protein
MKFFALAFTALISANAMADCDKVDWSSPPAIPNGANATTSEMLAARDQVVAFVRQGEHYLGCDKKDPFMHNLIAHHLELTAEQFNSERQRFLEQRAVVAVN